jgi:predicted nucleic acid-binding protein
VIEPGERFWEIPNSLIDSAQVSGPLMTDAALAALAIQHGATLSTTDRDFARLGALRTFDPTS